MGLFHFEIGLAENKINAKTNIGPQNNMYLSAPFVLKSFGFGPQCIHWVTTIFQNAESRVMTMVTPQDTSLQKSDISSLETIFQTCATVRGLLDW